MTGVEQNGWLVYEWGQTLRVAITPSPWESELVLTLFLPPVEGKENLFLTILLPADRGVTQEEIQQAFSLNQRRAEHVHQAFLDALNQFTADEEEEPEQPPSKVIPILPSR